MWKGFDEAAARVRLDERLADCRPNEMVRGVFFKMLRSALEERDRELLRAFEERVSLRPTTFALYPVGEYLRALVAAGALYAGPEAVAEGMKNIHRRSVQFFAKSTMGQMIIKVSRPTLFEHLLHVQRARDMMANYGSMSVEKVSERSVRVRFVGERVFIESAHLGGFLSVFDLCKMPEPHVEVVMSDPYNGSLTATW